MNDLMINELETQEERSAAVEAYLFENVVNGGDLDDLASWILHGIKGVSVRRKIELSKYKGAL